MSTISPRPLVRIAVLPLLLLPALACLRAGGARTPAPVASAPATPAPAASAAAQEAPTPPDASAPAALSAHGMRRGGMGPMMHGMRGGRMGMGGMAGPAGCPMRAAMLAAAGSAPDSATLAAVAACAGATKAEAAEGRKIFVGKGNCYTCHGMDAKGTPLAPNLVSHKWLNVDGSYPEIARVVSTGVAHPKEHPAPMPPMGGARLSPDEICDVAAYVYLLSHKE